MDMQYTKQAKDALAYAWKFAGEKRHPYVGTEHLLAGLVHEEEGTAGMVLRDLGVSGSKLSEMIDRLIAPEQTAFPEKKREYTPRAGRVLATAEHEAADRKIDRVGTEHLLLGMMREVESVGTRLLHTMGVSIPRLRTELLSAMGEEGAPRDAANQKQNAPQASRTPMLDQYGRDLTQLARDKRLDPVVGREAEIRRIIQILSRRTKNNPCLVGEPGVGKTAIVEGLAQRIVQGMVPDTIRGRRVVTLDLTGIVAGSKYRGEFEERIRRVIDEVMAHKGILLFIDELHTIIGAGGAEGALDASNILKPSLSRGEIQIIGATTREEYRKYIEKDAALERRFQPVSVEEPSEEDTLSILRGLRPCYESHHGVEITDGALKAAVQMASRYIPDRFLPDKAIDLMDEAGARVQLSGCSVPPGLAEAESRLSLLRGGKEEAIRSGDFVKAREYQEEQKKLEEEYAALKKRCDAAEQRKKKQVTEDEIARVVSDWTKIPVRRLAQQESKRLAKLERTLHQRVIGQEEAVSAVARAVRRGRVGLKDPARPVGSFLFLGPTGVGKTELSKALAEAVFGSEQAMIRVDMSEYMEKHSVSKMIGSPPGYVGYEEGGQLSEKVRRNPYSVILFDEIEKAHPDVFNILLQVLDDGHITDSQGRRVDFKQTIIIMTSNAGAQNIVTPKRLGFSSGADEKKDYEYMKAGVMEEVKRIFKPEFLNRIDETIVFHMLNKDEIRQIVQLYLDRVIRRCREQLDISLKIQPSVKAWLADAGYDPKYGARPLRRTIQTKLEDVLAEEFLEGKISRGGSVLVSMAKNEMKITQVTGSPE